MGCRTQRSLDILTKIELLARKILSWILLLHSETFQKAGIALGKHTGSNFNSFSSESTVFETESQTSGRLGVKGFQGNRFGPRMTISTMSILLGKKYGGTPNASIFEQSCDVQESKWEIPSALAHFRF